MQLKCEDARRKKGVGRGGGNGGLEEAQKVTKEDGGGRSGRPAFFN